MRTLKYNIAINASKEKVWNTLFTDRNYPKWVKVFAEGAYAKTDWKEGSSVDFLTPNGDGMFSKIHQKTPNKLMVFNHLGFIKEGKKVYDEKSKAWENAKESYELIEKNGNTELYVNMDTTEEYIDYFDKTFPKALKKIKELSEE
ncbi:SRPBCC domain-containing protein [Olleya sp. YS]|uniref:SRPBCC domain-containing protein n=1 Tax=Olleya sp. YS TaxID=3028318 RepID=UPI0024344D3A|nr:SRPBCC domain-containing protein [Olleya sp. YS]WGD34084.1 SRPBCC domain-containing protein [Olleya sp. YS]